MRALLLLLVLSVISVAFFSVIHSSSTSKNEIQKSASNGTKKHAYIKTANSQEDPNGSEKFENKVNKGDENSSLMKSELTMKTIRGYIDKLKQYFNGDKNKTLDPSSTPNHNRVANKTTNIPKVFLKHNKKTPPSIEILNTSNDHIITSSQDAENISKKSISHKSATSGITPKDFHEKSSEKTPDDIFAEFDEDEKTIIETNESTATTISLPPTNTIPKTVTHAPLPPIATTSAPIEQQPPPSVTTASLPPKETVTPFVAIDSLPPKETVTPTGINSFPVKEKATSTTTTSLPPQPPRSRWHLKSPKINTATPIEDKHGGLSSANDTQDVDVSNQPLHTPEKMTIVIFVPLCFLVVCVVTVLIGVHQLATSKRSKMSKVARRRNPKYDYIDLNDNIVHV